MAYEKHEWKAGDEVDVSALNKFETELKYLDDKYSGSMKCYGGTALTTSNVVANTDYEIKVNYADAKFTNTVSVVANVVKGANPHEQFLTLKSFNNTEAIFSFRTTGNDYQGTAQARIRWIAVGT